jgi:squalene synthase HpnC
MGGSGAWIDAGLAAWGPQGLSRCNSLEEAQRYCRQLARGHYENFSVASWLLPKSLRQDFSNIYAFCRWSDDLGDEATGDAADRMRLLDWWRDEFLKSSDRPSGHPVLLACRKTIENHRLSTQPFLDLVDAFQQDQTQTTYATQEELDRYCARSANPVGRILLELADVRSAECLQWSDHLCTGLQLVNFCQDVERDAEKGRIYLPRDWWSWPRESKKLQQDPVEAMEVDQSQWLDRRVSPHKQRLLERWTAVARYHLLASMPLFDRVPQWLQRDLAMFQAGGLAVLEKIASQRFDVWTERPKLSKWEHAAIVAGHSFRPLGADARQRQLEESQRTCRRIAASSRSSFYRSFQLLAPKKRRAMEAIYALARCVDDLADQRGSTPSSTGSSNPRFDQGNLSDSQWDGWLDAVASSPFQMPPQAKEWSWLQQDLFPAVGEAVHDFAIEPEWLKDLLVGVRMDGQPMVRMETEDQLRRYCYHVASTIGLCCLRIWGSPGDQADAMAIECGYAFQWTNMLRDIREDAAMNRIYWPRTELQRWGISEASWLAGNPDGPWQKMLADRIERTRCAFDQSWPIVDHLDLDGQRMFSLIWQSYRTLLECIAARIDHLWMERVRVGEGTKAKLLAAHCLSPWFVGQPKPPPRLSPESRASR